VGGGKAVVGEGATGGTGWGGAATAGGGEAATAGERVTGGAGCGWAAGGAGEGTGGVGEATGDAEAVPAGACRGGVGGTARDAGGEAENSPVITRPSSASYSPARSFATRSSLSRKRRSSARLASCASVGRAGSPGPTASVGSLGPVDFAASLGRPGWAIPPGLASGVGCGASFSLAGGAACFVSGAACSIDGAVCSPPSDCRGSIASSTSRLLTGAEGAADPADPCVDGSASVSGGAAASAAVRRLPSEVNSRSSSRSLRSSSASVPVTSVVSVMGSVGSTGPLTQSYSGRMACHTSPGPHIARMLSRARSARRSRPPLWGCVPPAHPAPRTPAPWQPLCRSSPTRLHPHGPSACLPAP
jgi:hypothetical protein